MMENSNNSRIVVITGGAKGIGLEIGLRFASEGDVVVLFDADEKAGSATARLLQQKNKQS